jgi:hypothetical protein
VDNSGGIEDAESLLTPSDVLRHHLQAGRAPAEEAESPLPGELAAQWDSAGEFKLLVASGLRVPRRELVENELLDYSVGRAPANADQGTAEHQSRATVFVRIVSIRDRS